MTMAEIWPVSRLYRGSMKDWRETSRPWKTRLNIILSPYILLFVFSDVKVDLLKQEAAQMTGTQPSATRIIREKEKEVLDAWSSLKSQVRRYSSLMMDKLHNFLTLNSVKHARQSWWIPTTFSVSWPNIVT